MRTPKIFLAIFVITSCGFSNSRSQDIKKNSSMLDKLRPLIISKTTLLLEEADNSVNSQFISHFGGMPYFEKGEVWPVNESTQKPLSFIFQIINDDSINLPDKIGVLQFYYDWDEMPWNSEDPGWLVKIYPAIDSGRSTIINPPENIMQTRFCTIDFCYDKSLPDWQNIFELDSAIIQLTEKINPDEPWAPFDEARTELIGEQSFSSYFGGYASWIQSDETPVVNGKLYRLLCQIDSEREAEIMWGDAGSIYLFCNPDNPLDIRFVLQCY